MKYQMILIQCFKTSIDITTSGKDYLVKTGNVFVNIL